MPSALPDGSAVPADGPVPAGVQVSRPFGIYLHVPFCASRCGYCDFNTYTDLGHLESSWADTACVELRQARERLGPVGVDTVFVGGGTPTLLPSGDLVRVLHEIDALFGLADGAEVTTEANPDSVTPGSLAQLREGGFTRISFGMQSASQHVLRTLDRTHTPGRPQQAVQEAYVAGFEQVSLDLIYGTPGESDADWATSLQAVLDAGPTHVSAYALIVEDGTALARQVSRGLLLPPDDDVLADRYLMADEALQSLGWYEVSNWGEPCRHNLGYWRGNDWWGVGPGAHSHVGGTRWWNAKHPRTWTGTLETGSPAVGRELLTDEDQRVERILLELRLAEGLPLSLLHADGLAATHRYVDEGLLTADEDRVVLTLRGRLLADAVVRDLVD